MKKRIIFKTLALISACALCFGLAACGNKGSSENEGGSNQVTDAKGSRVELTMECDGESLGSFVIELYPEYAPITVQNFLNLVDSGFYNGLKFHRVYEGFMAQGGDPEGTGSGGSPNKIKGEFAANGVNNTLSHTRGVVSMARRNSYDSASSQFFICFSDDYKYSLDGQYAAFGKVIEGMEVVDSFLEIEREYNGEQKPTKPVKDIIITSAEIIG